MPSPPPSPPPALYGSVVAQSNKHQLKVQNASAEDDIVDGKYKTLEPHPSCIKPPTKMWPKSDVANLLCDNV